MALNKAQTSLGVKIVLIFLVIAFVVSFIPVVGGFFGSGAQDTGTGTAGTDPVSQAGTKFGPQVESLTGLLQSDPESYTVLVQLGNTYFDWAIDVQKAAQTNQQFAGQDQPMWIAAKDAYGRAVAVQPGEPPVEVDFAIARFYTGDTTGAIATAEKVSKDNPTFAPAWFNLGIFYGALNQNDKAVASFEQYLKLDADGKSGNPDFAKSEISRLKGGAPSASPTTGAP